MTDLYFVPIEPLTERYSESWYRNIPKAFREAKFNVKVIDGEPLIDNDIQNGTFLDIGSTCHYKSTQLQKISKLFFEGSITLGSVFFFADIEFWGIEQVRLLSDMYKVPVYLTGFLHAASYTKGDAFEIAANYQQYTEIGWIAALDRVFVGSEYHKKAIIERRLLPTGETHLANKIVVTKNPLFKDDYKFVGLDKKRRMLLTNRFDNEKNPLATIRLFLALKIAFPSWEFIVTTSRKTFRSNIDDFWLNFFHQIVAEGHITLKVGLSKDEYHRELEQAAIVVSHSQEENYGYCVAESIIYKCFPLLYDAASHPEFVNGETSYLFDDFALAFVKAFDLIDKFNQGDRCELNMDWSGMDNIIHEIKSLAKEN